MSMSSCMGLSDITRFSILFTRLTMLWLEKARLIGGPSFQKWSKGIGCRLHLPKSETQDQKGISSIRRLSHPILYQHRILCRWKYHRVH
jgi:hypothetical protein